jgi:hypothetical protein
MRSFSSCNCGNDCSRSACALAACPSEPFTAVTHYRLSLVYRAAGRTADAQRESAEFQRLKDMKERLKQVYQEMRLQPVKQERPEADVAK